MSFRHLLSPDNAQVAREIAINLLHALIDTLTIAKRCVDEYQCLTDICFIEVIPDGNTFEAIVKTTFTIVNENANESQFGEIKKFIVSEFLVSTESKLYLPSTNQPSS